MIFFLRTQDNKSIIETQTNPAKRDLSSAINLLRYSDLLYSALDEIQFAEDINRLYELRGIWWEQEEENYSGVDDFVRFEYNKIAEKYGYNVVTD